MSTSRLVVCLGFVLACAASVATTLFTRYGSVLDNTTSDPTTNPPM